MLVRERKRDKSKTKIENQANGHPQRNTTISTMVLLWSSIPNGDFSQFPSQMFSGHTIQQLFILQLF